MYTKKDEERTIFFPSSSLSLLLPHTSTIECWRSGQTKQLTKAEKRVKSDAKSIKKTSRTQQAPAQLVNKSQQVLVQQFDERGFALKGHY